MTFQIDLQGSRGTVPRAGKFVFLVLTRVGLAQRGQLTSAPECGLRTQECCFWRGSQGPSPLRSWLAGSPQSGYSAPLQGPRMVMRSSAEVFEEGGAKLARYHIPEFHEPEICVWGVMMLIGG